MLVHSTGPKQGRKTYVERGREERKAQPTMAGGTDGDSTPAVVGESGLTAAAALAASSPSCFLLRGRHPKTTPKPLCSRVPSPSSHGGVRRL